MTTESGSVEAGVPVGTVTLLLGDVVGSSRLWDERGHDMAAAMSAWREAVSEVVAAHGGVHPAEQGEGDSFVAAFARASDAVASAVDLQLTLAGGPIRVRLGLHTGEVQLRDEANYMGPAVNRCARLRDVGHGGQILCSQVTADLVIDRLPTDSSLVDVGSHRLRDLARSERIFQVCHPELPCEFPPLRAMDTVPHNLPVELTSFVGRQTELTTTVAALDEARLITLTGSGGCGKTRLALQVAAERIERHADGVWFVALAAVYEPSAVVQAISQAVSATARSGIGDVDAVAAHLRDREVLLVMDNCEHVIGSVAEVAEALLRLCPTVKVLATSREPLGVPGELTRRVPSLSFPTDPAQGSVDDVAGFEAVELFLARTRHARPGFALTADNARVIAEICHRLDGLPLAIEFAAARTRALSPKQILAGLHDRFRLLTGGARTAVARQQTLEASIDWSYDLLHEAERAVLRRLSVFQVGFTLEAAEAICADDDVQPHHVLDLLSQLIDKSLVAVDDDGSSGRFRLLETMRLYASRRLADAGETGRASERHFHFFLEGARRRDREPEDTYRVRLRADYENLARALSWAAEQDDPALLSDPTARLYGFWVTSTHLADAYRWTRRAVDRNRATDSAGRARALGRLAQLAVLVEDLPAAADAADEGIAALRELGDHRPLVGALTARAFIAMQLAEPESARYAIEAVELAEQVGDGPGLANALATQGAIAVIRPAERATARQALERSIEVARACGAQHIERVAVGNLGILATQDCEPHRAVALLTEVLPGLRASGDGYFLSLCLANLADNLVRIGDLDAAASCHAELAQIADELGPVRFKFPQFAAGHLALARADWRAAAEHYRAIGFTPVGLAGMWEGRRAWAELLAGDLDSARRHLDTFLQECDPSRTSPALPLAVRALVARADGDLPAAEHLAHDAVAASPSDPHTFNVPTCLAVLAAIKADLGDHPFALRLCGAISRFVIDRGIVLLPAIDQLATNAEQSSRAELADDAGAAAHSEGMGMTLANAVSYAGRRRGPRRRPSSGWDGLTPTEVEVVKLVARGLSNPQIAESLLMSRRTVTTHITSIFRKLGFTSRAALAAEAVRRDVTASSAASSTGEQDRRA